MIPKDCKRLAEVDFPIAEVSRHAAREKAGPPGHPSRLHLWWARRPLASSRAMLLALLWSERPEGRCVVLLVDKGPLGGPAQFRIARGDGSENQQPGFVELNATKAKGNNANVTCPCCRSVLPGNKKNPRTSTQLVAQHGGTNVVFDVKGRRTGGAKMLAVVTTKHGEPGRQYRLPTAADPPVPRVSRVFSTSRSSGPWRTSVLCVAMTYVERQHEGIYRCVDGQHKRVDSGLPPAVTREQRNISAIIQAAGSSR